MGFGSKKMTHADGSMHHLGTRPQDVAPVMILTAGVEEVDDIALRLEQPKQTGLYREYRTVLGRVGDMSVGIMSCGHGCMPMAIAVEELNHLGVKTLIKVGTGAALQPGITPGTLIVPSACVRGEGASREYVNDTYPAVADLELVDLIVQRALRASVRPLVGIGRSHDAFYTEYPATGCGRDRVETWSKLGVLLLEHELSSMFVVSSILGLRSVGLYVVEENLCDDTVIDAGNLRRSLDLCYDLAVQLAAAL